MHREIDNWQQGIAFCVQRLRSAKTLNETTHFTKKQKQTEYL